MLYRYETRVLPEGGQIERLYPNGVAPSPEFPVIEIHGDEVIFHGDEFPTDGWEVKGTVPVNDDTLEGFKRFGQLQSEFVHAVMGIIAFVERVRPEDSIAPARPVPERAMESARSLIDGPRRGITIRTDRNRDVPLGMRARRDAFLRTSDALRRVVARFFRRR